MTDRENNPYKFYREIVEPMYAELLRQGIKLESVTEKNTKALNALARADSKDSQNAQSDYEIAFWFIVDAGFDVAQKIAVNLSSQANEILSDKEKTKWCARAPKEKVTEEYKNALKAFEAATEKATISTPSEREAAVYLFKEAATAYKVWIDLFDPELLEDFKYFHLKNAVRIHGVGFIVGVLASVTAAFIMM
ncbi:hypothetical protein [Nitrosospira sp. Nsp1]|uniref:hypothetical protein n=1 Tax=Nitrosospira sp. Nsp1 TaxID=136547 RepID=UPI00087FA829|nr:hypothetical protein [Nitrosospira sp. Nsp1]SCX56893.1 hypothetical protein SAMN05720354_11827 [Nitrosospira sp. Nsp1]